MAFTSSSFLFLFLPCFLAIFTLVGRRDRLTCGARLVIIGGTYVFYAFENVGYLLPFVFATTMDLLWSRGLRSTQNPRIRKAIVGASVVQNLALLFIYKYAAHIPGTGMIRQIFGGDDGNIQLPPGISFYLFESLSYVIDCYRREIEPAKNPLDFLTFITMFPRFIAGPIVRYSELKTSIENYRGARLADGGFIFAIGFTLKILGADSFARVVDPFFGHQIHFAAAWLTSLCYAFQLYLDFSGYSLMAIGLGLMIGMPFPDNFREPYLAGSITEFWRRWHVSLSTWLRDYLYIPLGGNRAGAGRAYVNLFVTMVLGGLWHGANSTFVIWGAYHGLLLGGERWLRQRGRVIHSPTVTFVLVLIGWVYFRATRAHEGLLMLKAMLGVRGFEFSQGLKIVFLLWPSLLLGAFGIAWTFGLEPFIRRRRGGAAWHQLSVENVSAVALTGVASLFLLSLFLAGANRKIPFLYFQF